MNPVYNYERVYFVESTQREHTNKIAIRPKIYPNKVVWENTSRGKSLDIKRVKAPENLTDEAPAEIALVDKQNKVVRLRELTLEIYNEHVKAYVAGSPEFTSNEELQEFYLKQNFQQNY